MTDTPTVIVTGEASNSLELPSPEVQAEALETVADSAVEIAQIHADKEVAIAEIHADTAEAHIELEQARIDEHSERDELWQTITDLKAQMSALGEAVTATAEVVEQLASPPVLLTPEASPAMETLQPEELVMAATTDTSGTNTETSSETKTEVPESVSVPVVVQPRHKLRMI